MPHALLMKGPSTKAADWTGTLGELRRTMATAVPTFSPTIGSRLVLTEAAAELATYKDAALTRLNEIGFDGPRLLWIRTHIERATSTQQVRDILSKELTAEEERIMLDLGPILAERDRLGFQIEALRELEAWRGPHTLGNVGESLFHKVFDQPILSVAAAAKEIERDKAAHAVLEAFRRDCVVYLVQHDWAAVMESADVDEGAYRLPAEANAFEFRVGARRVCLVVLCHEGEPYRRIALIQTRAGWVIPYDDDPLSDLLEKHVRAIAITLDAEVTQAEVIRAPHKLNASRIAQGRGPLYDYRLLSLVRRPRPARMLPDPDRPIYRKRLHFRRGHWRHFPNHKTWIKWMLVGNPDLGFADKDYRL